MRCFRGVVARRVRGAAVLVITLLTLALAAPSGASAAIAPGYIGWARLHHHCAGMRACTQQSVNYTGWAWSGSSWSLASSATLTEGTPVYVSPFGSGWHWAWTSRTGWLLFSTTVIDPYYLFVAR